MTDAKRSGRISADAGWKAPKKNPATGCYVCRYCAGDIPAGSRKRTFHGDRTKFCYERGNRIVERAGEGCLHEHLIRSDPGYARDAVWERDHGKCAECGTECSYDGRSWQADHIVPVVEGGGACGLENLRTLCTGCHKLETKKLASKRAAERRASKESELDIQTIGKVLDLMDALGGST